MTDSRQPRPHGLDPHARIPSAAATQLEIGRITLLGMDPFIAQDNHLPVKLLEQGMKGGIRGIGSRTVPGHYQPQVIEQQAELAPHNPALIGFPSPADLLGTTPLTEGVDQLNAIAIHDSQHGGGGRQEPVRPGVMGGKQAQETRTVRQARKQWSQVIARPAVDRSRTAAFESKEDAQPDHLTGLQTGLPMFGDGFHHFVYPIEQLTDKVLCGHAGLLGLQVCSDLQLEGSVWPLSRASQTSTVGYYASRKSVTEATGTKNKAEARRMLQARLGQLAEGRFVGPAVERVTFDELAQDFLTEYEVNGRKSLHEARIQVNKHLIPFFGDKRAHQITTADVQAFIAQRQAERASNGEINRELAALKRMYNLALRAEKIAKRLYVPKFEEDNARQGFLERDDLNRLLAQLPDYLRPPLGFAYFTGWRIKSEIIPLTWDRVDLDTGTVRLYRGTAKNKDGRVIALPPCFQLIVRN